MGLGEHRASPGIGRVTPLIIPPNLTTPTNATTNATNTTPATITSTPTPSTSTITSTTSTTASSSSNDITNASSSSNTTAPISPTASTTPANSSDSTVSPPSSASSTPRTPKAPKTPLASVAIAGSLTLTKSNSIHLTNSVNLSNAIHSAPASASNSPRTLTSPRPGTAPPHHIVGHKPHTFQEIHFSKPTFCSLASCQGFIWGLTKQGYSCTVCNFAVHKRCMVIAMENEICPGRQLNESHLKKMTLKKKIKHVNRYLEELMPMMMIPYVDDFKEFMEVASSDPSGIHAAIPNLFESFKNKELAREGIVSLVTALTTAEEPVWYFIVSILHAISLSDVNKPGIVKSGAVAIVLTRLVSEDAPLTAMAPSLSLLEQLFQHHESLQEILFQASINPTLYFEAFRQIPRRPPPLFERSPKKRITLPTKLLRLTPPRSTHVIIPRMPEHRHSVDKSKLLDATTVGATLAFAARKRNPTGIQNLLNNLVSLSKIELIHRDDLLLAKVARIICGTYKEEGIQQYVERCGGHELVVKAAMKQLVVLHTEIAENDVRFDYDGLLYDSPLCRVFRGTYDKKRVAIKVFSSDSLGFDLQNFNKEIALMSIVHGENVVKCYGVHTKNTDSPFVVMEYFSNGSLHDFVTLAPYDIPLRTRVYLMLGAANGVRFLHEKSIIHRDIKTQNFMVSEDFYKCKVIDFGVSRVDATLSAKKTIVGTPVFMAPEVMHDKQYTFSADSYSFGLVIYEMVTKNPPYFDINPLRVADHILSHRPSIPPDCDPVLARTMKACWSHEPSARPLFPQIVDMLSQVTFTLGVKTHRKYLPDIVLPQTSPKPGAVPPAPIVPEDDVVDFARLYLVLDVLTYEHVFLSLDKHDLGMVRETCKYWKGIVDEELREEVGR